MIYVRDNKNRKMCDLKMLDDLEVYKVKNPKQWLDRNIIKNLISAKNTLGLGINFNQ